jgi:hypothetical protein
MGDIAVGKNGLVHRVFCEQPREFLFRVNRNAFGIMRSGKLSVIDSIGNERDLCGSESENTVLGMLSKVSVEIMEIPSTCPKDDHPNGLM